MKQILTFLLLLNVNLMHAQDHNLKIDPEIYDYILLKASSLSGLPAFQDKIPTVLQMSHDDMYSEVCEEDINECRGMAAFFDTERFRILIRDDLDMDNDTDNSFLLHELVHALQYLKDGDRIFEDCRATLKTERQAYDVQNAYLRERGQFFQAGARLRFATCPD